MGHETRIADGQASEMVVGLGGRTVRLTRLGQRWWPDRGLFKADVVAYYRRVAAVLLPHLRDRPFTMKRHYNGPRSPFEWVKDAPSELPAWIRVSSQPARSRGGALVRYPLVQDELSLLWMLEYGCVDLHVWTSRADRPDRPDVVLFDLDPVGVPFADVVRAALLLRVALEALRLRSCPLTTGGEGLHVRVPVARRHTYAETRALADTVVRALARSADGLVTLERRRDRRRGVFVDTKMNGQGQQVVTPYSVRPLPQAAVTTPLAWDEVGECLDPAALDMAAVLERVERLGDLAAPLLRGGQRLGPTLRRLG
jgi:bifunctional non-homologous end joining protein LigD